MWRRVGRGEVRETAWALGELRKGGGMLDAGSTWKAAGSWRKEKSCIYTSWISVVLDGMYYLVNDESTLNAPWRECLVD